MALPSTPRPDVHAELCVAVAELGVPLVFCEKAIAASMEARLWATKSFVHRPVYFLRDSA